MTGKRIVDFIKRHRLEDCDEINLDNDTINFNIILSDGEWIMYSLFDFGVGEDIVLWPSPENAELGYKEISFDEALILRGLKKEKEETEIKQAIKRKDWNTVYNKTERWYNKYPVQMSRQEVFRNLEKDEYITDENYNEARVYFKTLWNYVGD